MCEYVARMCEDVTRMCKYVARMCEYVARMCEDQSYLNYGVIRTTLAENILS